MSGRRITVVTAGLSQPSTTRLLADQLADAVRSAVTGRGETAEVTVIEVRELASDLATAMTTGGLITPALEQARAAVSGADGVIAVTPVFSASYSGLFKMFFDALDGDALDGVPVLVAATAGSARHSLVLDHALRPLFSYLRAVVVPTGVFAATEDFGGEWSARLAERIGRAASQFAALVVTGEAAVGGFAPNTADRRRGGRPGEAAGADAAVDGVRPVTPFTELLRGHTGT